MASSLVPVGIRLISTVNVRSDLGDTRYRTEPTDVDWMRAR